jgi:hypothetical protein
MRRASCYRRNQESVAAFSFGMVPSTRKTNRGPTRPASPPRQNPILSVLDGSKEHQMRYVVVVLVSQIGRFRHHLAHRAALKARQLFLLEPALTADTISAFERPAITILVRR